MSDDDRLLATAERILDDACLSCDRSKVYCRCVMYIDGDNLKCCPSCSH